MLVPILIACSLLNGAAAFWIFRQTSSRKAMISNAFASVAQLYGAKLVYTLSRPDIVFGLSFLTAMILVGRGVGAWFNRQPDPLQKMAASIWLTTGFCSLAACGAVYALFVRA